MRNNTPHYLKPKIKPDEKLRTMTFARVVFCRPCMYFRFVVPPIMRTRKRVQERETEREREREREMMRVLVRYI